RVENAEAPWVRRFGMTPVAGSHSREPGRVGASTSGGTPAASGLPAMVRAGDVMRRSVATVGPSDSLARASEMMHDFGVRELPVVEDGAIVGIVARSDLLPHVGQLEWTPVRVAMSAPPRTVATDAPIGEVVSALLAGDFNGIPVVDRDRSVAGMIARRDLLR